MRKLPENCSMYRAAKLNISDSPIQTAIVFYGKKYTFQEVFDTIDTLADNLAAAESFLADNAAREGIITLDSGLQLEYTYDDKSDSARPAEDSIVVVDYTLTLMDGTVMDQGEDVEFSLQNLIPGFSEAVMQMNVGDSVRAYVHPSLGYGENGTPTIQPNSLLIFDITLDSIK